MSLAQFIKDNTNDGTDIASVLIDVMNDRLDGCSTSLRLTAARLLIIYGHDDAPDFIADNTPDREPSDTWRKTIDPELRKFVASKTDDGRDMCRLLIDVLHGRFEKATLGHRVSAAKELLGRAFGNTPTRSLPKPQRSATPAVIPSEAATQVASGNGVHLTSQPESPTKQHTDEGTARPVLHTESLRTPIRGDSPLGDPEAPGEALTRDFPPPTPRHPEAEARRRQILFDIHNDPVYTILDSEIYDLMCECKHPDFDPHLAALDEDYFQSFTACKDSDCVVHGEDSEVGFEPNDFHY